ncbi:MAG: hypothetical protein ACLUYZ_10075 [Lachnospiraceae bacterium]
MKDVFGHSSNQTEVNPSAAPITQINPKAAALNVPQTAVNRMPLALQEAAHKLMPMLYRSYNLLRAITSYMLGKSLVKNIKLFHG